MNDESGDYIVTDWAVSTMDIGTTTTITRCGLFNADEETGLYPLPGSQDQILADEEGVEGLGMSFTEADSIYISRGCPGKAYVRGYEVTNNHHSSSHQRHATPCSVTTL